MNPNIPDAQERAQALNTEISCIVQAPAGSGKTTLLAQRYIHLLSQVQRPEEILAITFTKKAAAEMRHRIIHLLQQPGEINEQVRQRSKALDWQLFANPNVLKIQTIDSFALNVASHTPTLRGTTGSRGGIAVSVQPQMYYVEAVERFVAQLIDQGPNAPLVAEFIASLDNDVTKVQRLLLQMLASRDQWLGAVTEVATNRDPTLLSNLLNKTISALQTAITQQFYQYLNRTDIDHMQRLADAVGCTEHVLDLMPVLTTKNGKLRKRITAADGVEDKALARELSAWLGNLHERELGPAAEICAKLPRLIENPKDTELLTLSCICLSLAIIELDQIFSQHNLTDFTGLLLQAKTALVDSDGPTDLALYLDTRINHLLIDEFQDTSRSQADFFAQLVEGWQPNLNTVFVVGDPMQSIYRFRDADVAVFAESQAKGFGHMPLHSIVLSANFRSAPPLVDWCNTVFATLLGTQSSPELGQVPFSPAVAMVEAEAPGAEALHFEHEEHEVSHILENLKKLLDKDADSTIAILCRVRNHVAPLLAQMRALGIKFQATDMDGLAHKAIVSDLQAVHKVLLSPHDQLAWMSLLRSPLFGLSLETLTRLQTAGEFPAALDTRDAAQARLAQALQWAHTQLDELTLREVMEGLWWRCGGLAGYEDTEYTQAIAWFDLLEDLGPQAYDPAAVELALTELYEIALAPARIQVMTIHKAKGLEFDHVIVPHLDRASAADEAELLSWRPHPDGLLMGIKDDEIHRWLRYEEQQRARNEEMRLLYVACTRARQSLLLTYTRQGDRKVRGPARHISTFAQAGPPQPQDIQQQDLFNSLQLERIPEDYRWTPPHIAAAQSTATNPSIKPIGTPDLIAGRLEVAVGNLVHRCLAWYTQTEEPRVQQWPTLLPRWARQLNIPPNLQTTAISAATEHIQRTLADPTGLWLLSNHPEAASELALSGIMDNTLLNIVVDRLFVTGGYRWIIDYKTATPARSEEAEAAFINNQVARYRPQLLRYKTLVEPLSAEPIKTALYFTGISHLEEVRD